MDRPRPALSSVVCWIPLSLFLLCALFPPEARGESLAGCAGLIALFAIIAAREGDPRRALPLVTLIACAVPLALAADARGAAVEPLAIAVLAGALGLCTAQRVAGRAIPAWTAVVAVAGGLVGLHAIYQLAWGLEAMAARWAGDPAVSEVMLERIRTGRAFASFPTPAALGGFLALALPVSVGAAVGHGMRRRWPLWLSIGLQVGGLLAARSATAVGALLVAAVLAALGWKGSRRRVVVACGLALAVLVGVVALRGRSLIDPSDPESPWRLRAGNFRIAASVIADHPWLGVGPGGFGEAYPRYRLAGDNESQHAHNLPLELTAELGLAGGLVASAFFFYVFLGPIARSMRGPVGWRRGASVGLAAFALHNLADFTAFLPSVLWSACLLRGWIADPEPTPREGGAGLSRAPALAGTIVAALLAGLGGLAWNQRTLARESLLRGQIAEADTAARQATRLAPWSADGWLLAAQVSIAGQRPGIGQVERALAHAGRAIELTPVRPFARHLRARLRLALGDAPGGYADELQAAALYPLRGEYAAGRDEIREILRSPIGPRVER